MKALKPNDVFIEVPVSERLPETDGRYFAISEDEFEGGNIFLQGEFIGDGEYGKTTSWLEKQSLFTHTREELEAVFNEIWAASGDRFWGQEYGPIPNPYPDQQTFISNLFTKTDTNG